MEVTGTRSSIAGDWLIAAALLGATLLVGVLVVRELRAAPRAAAGVPEPVGATSAAVPSDAVSVPTLTLQYADKKKTDVVIGVTERAIDQRVALSGALQDVEINKDDGTLAEYTK